MRGSIVAVGLMSVAACMPPRPAAVAPAVPDAESCAQARQVAVRRSIVASELEELRSGASTQRLNSGMAVGPGGSEMAVRDQAAANRTLPSQPALNMSRAIDQETARAQQRWGSVQEQTALASKELSALDWRAKSLPTLDACAAAGFGPEDGAR
ncbi:MAG TPA: hypothetical protein VF761_04105 [Gemmatimonadaceae bacterium]